MKATYIILAILISLSSCVTVKGHTETDTVFKTGAERTDVYLPILKDKRVALLVNHTSIIGTTHIVDSLLALDINIVKIFAPEHGFRGDADAGEKVNSTTDSKTGLPVVSLYGNNKKPTAQQMADVDVVIFDIQDVGVRFYTYISSMHYMMEACAENNRQLIILDRPNPNGDYVDGPILETGYKSFVGMHPIPVVHGLTVGELAMMINGEGWLDGNKTCNITMVEMDNYTHDTIIAPTQKPSPNLPNLLSIRLYPSLCWFEGTDISVARGTYFPFQAIGYPDARMGSFTFTPVGIDGMAKNPPQKDKLCYGTDLRNDSINHTMTLKYLIEYYNKFPYREKFFSNARFFDLLAGTNKLRLMIIDGKSENEIRESWQEDLNNYNSMREKYLLYPKNKISK